MLSAGDTNGSAAIDLAGDDANNNIWGNAAVNVIEGGDGHDHLFGFGGADTFLFNTGLWIGNMDTIYDWISDGPHRCDVSVFSGMTAGGFDPNSFRIGVTGSDANTRISYVPDSGAIFFDLDGSGPRIQTLFAAVTAGMSLSASDFVFV